MTRRHRIVNVYKFCHIDELFLLVCGDVSREEPLPESSVMGGNRKALFSDSSRYWRRPTRKCNSIGIVDKIRPI